MAEDSYQNMSRLLLLNEVETALLATNFTTVSQSIGLIDETLELFAGLLDKISVFISSGDTEAFMVSKTINDLMFALKQQRSVLMLQIPSKRDVYITGASTLQFVAEDELGRMERWPELLKINSIKYSTDLLSRVTIKIP